MRTVVRAAVTAVLFLLPGVDAVPATAGGGNGTPIVAPVRSRLPCLPQEAMRAALMERWGETRRATGLIGAHATMELYASPQGSWTVLVTSPAKLSCILAAGDNFDRAPPALLPGHDA